MTELDIEKFLIVLQEVYNAADQDKPKKALAVLNYLVYEDIYAEALQDLLNWGIDLTEYLHYIPTDYITDKIKIQNYSVPTTVSRIEDRAIHNPYIQKIVVPESVTTIGESAFRDCFNLQTIQLNTPELTTIYNETFMHAGLKEIVLPEKVTYIGPRVFFGCTDLEAITLNSELFTVSAGAFSFTESLTKVYITDLLAYLDIQFEAISASFFNSSSTGNKLRALYLNGQIIKNLLVPSGITKIKRFSFLGNTALESVKLSDTVKTLEDGCFFGCTALTKVDCGKSLTRIDRNAFGNCPNLTELILPTTVTNIHENVFQNFLSAAQFKRKELTIIYDGADVQFWNINGINQVLANIKKYKVICNNTTIVG